MNIYKTTKESEDIYCEFGENTLRWYRKSMGWLSESCELPAIRINIDFQDVPQELQEEIMAISIRSETINIAKSDDHLAR
tara:strand:+ start:359 stop:598 length:240 start_codon:yes stop_codon:yes gene_type:complete